MRIVTIDIPVYTFDELENDIKSKVIDDNSSCIRPNSIFHDETIAKIKTLGFENIKLYYSFSNSQGDGLCFIGSINIAKLKSIPLFWVKVSDICSKSFLKDLEECCNSIEIYKTTYNYDHSRTVNFNIDNNSWCDAEMYMKFLDTFKNYYRNLCSFYEKEGYKYFYEISFEDGKEWADMNNLEFTKDGTVFNQST